MSKNMNLKKLTINDAKKITMHPTYLQTAPVIESVKICGDIFSGYPMESLSCFSQMAHLKHLILCNIKLLNHDLAFLDSTPSLEQFDFNAGMLTTEEIAWICAKYPKLIGQSLCAYNREDALLNDVRICGYKKPGLDLPKQQDRLDKYVEQFNKLVENYQKE